MKRVISLDYSRGINFLVVLLHVTLGFRGAGLIESDMVLGILDKWRYLSITMPVFFIISGIFVVRGVHRPLKQFMTTRIFGLVYPYLLWSLIILLLATIGKDISIQGRGLSAKTVLEIFIYPHGVYWFFYVLFIIHTIYVLMVKFGKKSYYLPFAFSLLVIGQMTNMDGLPFGLERLFLFTIFFAIGATFSERILKILPSISARLLSMTVIIAFAVFSLVWFSDIDLTLPFVSPVTRFIGMIGSLAVFELLARTNRLRIFYWMGLFSLEIYIIHDIVNKAARIILDKILNVPPSIIFPIVLIVSIAIPIIMAKIVRHYQIPYIFRWTAPIIQKKPVEKVSTLPVAL
jgi:fucose 4-O-acetylase-like acetyltransferase